MDKLTCWMDLTFLKREDIIEIASIKNQMLNQLMGDIIVSSLFGNNNSCESIWVSENNPDNLCVFYSNQNGQFNLTISIDEVVDKMNGKILHYGMEVER